MRFVSNVSFSLITCAAAGLAFAEGATEVPPQLRTPDGELLALTLKARGVQVYECRAVKGSAYAYEWALVGPEAELRDAQGQLAGRHYAGPRWEASDGSRIVGTVKTRADAPQAGAIPWLLMAAKSDGADGAFSRVSSVQRVNTAGGVAPASGCSETTLGTPARVDYTADYRMYVPR